ncbi:MULTISPECIES: nucleotidyl transferase AbiEii/AbiGii toxin family protein [Aequorivita]|jgi:predicted nucleotidyltransferase component of viral defense system|uniref:Nucleotidyl transferase AbiEii/AbiGii toxin family protein n=1 Tax=Aequorivita iocasae TaxID=2803865 RepID=A0ABX7DW36_9FLAO|nr:MULTISPECIES: nucleotidyl transferase AbiEii/AbiGii toxin family protein [Aequorivita]MRT16857.1 nucleotidyl transferase AbiEii/AbiGii toxin family protein [Aequorivita lutea]QQX77995.1 nucleotidyl transferase AbiEii/AbiGii toxin family protein [Aequorivita iocasae]UCA57498.1 nucleotidyl transferase AbiEii/AbiGii toxin family protein [Aequorivita sp. F7]
MIENKSFTKEWLDIFRAKKEHKGINVTILEKMVHAFSLLEHLKIEGLNFVFKGGTSLVLLLEEGNRFSIDIDIISSLKRDALEKILDTVVANSHFKSHTLNERRSYKEGVPKAHYTFEFDSVYNPNVPGTILLDILFDSPHYPELIESSIEIPWLSVNEPIISITTPSVNSICGDKLTAFAPETIGIPYYKQDQLFAMEICKQLFDLGKLFENITDISIVKKSFSSFAKAELSYRSSDENFNKRNLTETEVLWDSINTCAIISKRERNSTAETKKKFEDLNRGIRSFGSAFLMTGHFRIEEAMAASARVAYLNAILLQPKIIDIEYYEGQDISELTIEKADWAYLNKLKRQPDKSIFYYWYKAVELL